MRKRHRRGSLGFTLTELMVVIVVISVLSAIAYPSLRKQMLVARGREGVSLMQAIAAAEEGFRAEHMVYLTTSPTGLNYPTTTPTSTQYHFRQPTHPDYARWEVLAPELRSVTRHVFTVRAGLPGTTNAQFPAAPGTLSLPMPATAPSPWYVIYGSADLDDDAKLQYVGTSNLNPTLVTTDLGE